MAINQGYESKNTNESSGEQRINNQQSKSQNQKKNGRWASTFKGATPDMNGKVFQLQSKHTKKG